MRRDVFDRVGASSRLACPGRPPTFAFARSLRAAGWRVTRQLLRVAIAHGEHARRLHRHPPPTHRGLWLRAVAFASSFPPGITTAQLSGGPAYPAAQPAAAERDGANASARRGADPRACGARGDERALATVPGAALRVRSPVRVAELARRAARSPSSSRRRGRNRCRPSSAACRWRCRRARRGADGVSCAPRSPLTTTSRCRCRGTAATATPTSRSPSTDHLARRAQPAGDARLHPAARRPSTRARRPPSSAASSRRGWRLVPAAPTTWSS